MNKAELIEALHSEVSELQKATRQDVEVFLNAFIGVVSDALKSGEHVKLVGFGTFTVAERAPRKGRDMTTGKMVAIPSCKAPQFKPGETLRGYINA